MKQKINQLLENCKTKAAYIKSKVNEARKNPITISVIAALIAVIGIVYPIRGVIFTEISSGVKTHYSKIIGTIQIENDVQTEKTLEDERVGQYVLYIMGMRSKINMSDFQKQLMAQTIVRVSGNVFDNEDERKWFIILINNESGFDKSVKSPAGAVGLTQVMPQYIEEFGGHCDIRNVSTTEVFDMEVNLTLGACRFKHLLNNYKGVYSTALAAYNGGKNARSVKEIQSLSKITTTETLQYIARFTHVKATADAFMKNNPEADSLNSQKLKVSTVAYEQ